LALNLYYVYISIIQIAKQNLGAPQESHRKPLPRELQRKITRRQLPLSSPPHCLNCSTSDLDLHPTDASGLRDAFMQSFRVRGIVPDDSSFFSDTAIAWPMAKELPPIMNLDFGDPSGLTAEQQRQCKQALQAYFDVPEHRRRLGFDEKLPIIVPSFHPIFRIQEDGSLRTEMVVVAIQNREALFDAAQPALGSFPVRGGVTLLIGKPSLVEIRRQVAQGKYIPHGKIRYVIGKHLHGSIGHEREERQRRHYERMGLIEGSDPDRFQIDFALTHGGF